MSWYWSRRGMVIIAHSGFTSARTCDRIKGLMLRSVRISTLLPSNSIMPVISNTSPLLNLAIVENLFLLRQQFGQIYISAAVLAFSALISQVSTFGVGVVNQKINIALLVRLTPATEPKTRTFFAPCFSASMRISSRCCCKN